MSKNNKFWNNWVMETLKNLDKILENKLKKINTAPNNFNYQEELFSCDENFKNRFYFENLTDDPFFDYNGATNDFVNYYKKIIKSGVGVIVMGGVKPGLDDKFFNNQARISLNNKTLFKYKIITKLAHSNNAKILLKIQPNMGRFNTKSKYDKTLKYASNFCLDPENRRKIAIRISDNKCNELICNISRSVLYSNICGFDGIMIDASLSNIIGELTSPEYNKRNFGYFSNPDDFLTKTLKSIDVKNNFIILKLSVLSLFEYKKGNSELCSISKTVNIETIFNNIKKYIELGVDGFEFVFGRMENEFLTNFNQFEECLLFDDFITEFRDYLNKNNIKTKNNKDVLIFYKDNINDFEKINGLVKSNTINFVDVTKNIYSDLNFLTNIKNAKKVKNCLKCSYCNRISRENQNIDCLINPELVNFEEYKLENKSKKVAVIGSGISGMICAITLAKRGFIVDLFEQENILNPIGKLTSIFNFDKAIFEYFKYIEEELTSYVKAKRVNILLNTKFNINNNDISQYYSIILGTGFKTKYLSVSGAVQNHVINIYDSLKNEQIMLSKKHIVIYAKSELSLKLALFLITKKKNITLIIKDLKLFNLNKNANLYYYFYKLYRLKTNILFLSRITKINEDNIDVVINKNLKDNLIDNILKLFSNSKIKEESLQINIDCDCLIFEPELSPNNKLFIDIVNQKYKGEVYLIGNALENSDLAECIKSGYFVGKNL